MAMHVIFPGPRTMIQDKGRLGYQNSGFAPSGFMDRVGSHMANVLVDNEDSEAVLEFCLVGPILQFDEETYDRFLTLCDWYLLMNGRMYVESCNDATEVARDLYNEKYGENIMPGNWTAWSLEDRIALENFIREHPDFMPVEEFEKELRYLGILTE